MLKGWKAIAAHLGRDERTAMRWAAERGLPVHRVPGPGRGSVYALAEEIDAWLAADRKQTAVVVQATDAPRAPPDGPLPAIDLSPLPPWRQYRGLAAALLAGGALLIALGAFTLFHPAAPASVPPRPAFADAATKALFLQASYDWNRRTGESLIRAVREYGEVIGRDPRVTASYVGLADSYLLLREFGSMPDALAYPRAEAAAKAAVALSPQSPETHRALAFIAFWWRQDRAVARREFARAIALRPDDPLTHHWFANALLANNQPQAALREIDIARELDPTSTSILADRSYILYFAGRREEGLGMLRLLAREQPELVSPHRALAQIALAEGRVDEYLHEAETQARLRGDDAGLAEVARLAAEERRPGAIEATMVRDAKAAHADWFRLAQIEALAGRGDEAKGALTRACEAHEPATVSAHSDPWLSQSLTPSDIVARCGYAPSLD